MDPMDFAVAFHRDAYRQGPGSDESTLQALKAVPDWTGVTSILDLGCGTGAQTMVLAMHTNAQITAVDVLPEFLEELEERARRMQVGDRVTPRLESFDELTVEPGSFELLWSEGSIYHLGFTRGLEYWKQFIAPDGHLVVSDLCWTSEERPAEIDEFWTEAYPEIATVEQKLAVIEASGYEVVDWFELPQSAWTDNYYEPIRSRSPKFIEDYGKDPAVVEFVQMGLEEANLFDRFGEFYGYVFFVVKPVSTVSLTTDSL